MIRLWLTLAFTFAALSAAYAETQSAKDPDVDKRVEGMKAAQAVTLVDGLVVPGFQPKLTNLKRSYAPSAEKLISQFLGEREGLLGSEAVVSPVHGRGTRHKSGTAIYALPMDNRQPGQKQNWDLKKLPRLESVPAFLDIYPTGFLYTNNIPHKAVSMPDVKVNSGVLSAKHRNLFSPAEGQTAAEQILAGVGTGMGLPKGFRLKTVTMIQDFGERLFSFRAWPEYLTTYTVYKGDARKASGEQPIAVPVKDIYAHVLLDGDKVLASAEYFWDSSLAPTGTPKESIQASVALLKGREWILKRYNNNPPLMSVGALTLGYINKPGDRTTLVPAWIFDAWYVTAVKSRVADNDSSNPERIYEPFAVDALTGEVYDL